MANEFKYEVNDRVYVKKGETVSIDMGNKKYENAVWQSDIICTIIRGNSVGGKVSYRVKIYYNGTYREGTVLESALISKRVYKYKKNQIMQFVNGTTKIYKTAHRTADLLDTIYYRSRCIIMEVSESETSRYPYYIKLLDTNDTICGYVTEEDLSTNIKLEYKVGDSVYWLPKNKLYNKNNSNEFTYFDKSTPIKIEKVDITAWHPYCISSTDGHFKDKWCNEYSITRITSSNAASIFNNIATTNKNNSSTTSNTVNTNNSVTSNTTTTNSSNNDGNNDLGFTVDINIADEDLSSPEDLVLNTLKKELYLLQAPRDQDPETGRLREGPTEYIKYYTNRIFGAPYQFLKSVDGRLKDVNTYVGNEYLRNFLLSAPILSIRPGLPKYTANSNAQTLQNIFDEITHKAEAKWSNTVAIILKNTLFKAGKDQQTRMFGFRETYYQYMQHVNYMCRSMATYLGLTGDDANKRFPNGVHTENNIWTPFETMRWDKYHMLERGSVTKTPFSYMKDAIESNAGYQTGNTIWQVITGVVSMAGTGIADTFNLMNGNHDINIIDVIANMENEIDAGWDKVFNVEKNMNGLMTNKITSVKFMVDPTTFRESYSNETKSSKIEEMIDSVNEIGSELAFVTQTNVDAGVLGGLVEFLGDTVTTASTKIADLAAKINSGGFVSNLFKGAVGALKGQKLLYPEIYDKSSVNMNYTFTIKLSSPYGDPYNYYMNIVVPLMHLIALAVPRLVTSNSSTCPYLVQCFIPGMCTVNLGIIQSMNITKNPTGKHVSVNGFPLSVDVEITVKELYQAMAISPANDPSSFLWNDTLNDYMANLAGLTPCLDVFRIQRDAALKSATDYFTNSESGGGNAEFLNELATGMIESIEDASNPFIGR